MRQFRSNEFVAKVQKLAEKRWSMSEIARHLGVTRNVIAGVGFRNGITFSMDPTRRRQMLKDFAKFRWNEEGGKSWGR